MLSEKRFQREKLERPLRTQENRKTQEGGCVDSNNILKIKLSTEARCFSLCKVKLNVVVCGAS